MAKLKILFKNELEEHIYDISPIPNICNSQEIFEKRFLLTLWHQYYNLHTYEQEQVKLKSLLGEPTFIGKEFNDIISFFTSTTIWGCSYDDNIFAIYLSEEGLTVEVNDDLTESNIHKILDLLIRIIIHGERSYF